MALVNGLNIRKKVPPQRSIFDSGDGEGDDDDVAQQPTARKPPPTQIARSSLAKEAAELSGAEAAIAYDYDGVYDSLKAADRQQAAEREAAKRDRRPQYMADLLTASDTRKRDRQRVEDDRIRAEREAEEAAGIVPSEKFVTSGYKEKLAADDAAARNSQAHEDDGDHRNGADVGQFTRNLTQKANERREAAVAASLNARLGDDKAVEDDRDTSRRSDPHARRNDNGEIVDKRELLAAGLNRPAPSSRDARADETTHHLHRGHRPSSHRDRYHDGGGRYDRRGGGREQADLRRQLAEKEDRERQVKRARDEALLASLARRTTDAEVEAARQRYFERVRRKKASAAEP